jgi:hypothetical protein
MNGLFKGQPRCQFGARSRSGHFDVMPSVAHFDTFQGSTAVKGG